MPASLSKLLLLILIVAPISGQAQDQCPTNPTADYELTAATGTPVPLTSNFSYTRKNDTSVLIRLEDINPYAFKCTVASTSVPFKEPDISGFTSLIGGVAGNLGANIPATSSPHPHAYSRCFTHRCFGRTCCGGRILFGRLRFNSSTGG